VVDIFACWIGFFLVEIGTILYGIWFCLALCGVFGRKEMIEAFKIVCTDGRGT
jgi:hypothetical protein